MKPLEMRRRFSGAGASEDFGAGYRARLRFMGADSATSITDDVGNAWFVYGDAQIDTSLGDHRMLFDGAGGDFIATAASLGFASAPFKLEFGLRWNSKTGYQTIMSNGYVTDQLDSFILQTGNGNGLLNIYRKNTLIVGESATSAATGTDYDYVIERASGVLTIKRNGVTTGSASSSHSFSNQVFSIGGGSNSGYNAYWFNGWMKDFRMSF